MNEILLILLQFLFVLYDKICYKNFILIMFSSSKYFQGLEIIKDDAGQLKVTKDRYIPKSGNSVLNMSFSLGYKFQF